MDVAEPEEAGMLSPESRQAANDSKSIVIYLIAQSGL
jgi:hypothetical protein